MKKKSLNLLFFRIEIVILEWNIYIYINKFKQNKFIAKTFSSTVHLIYGTTCQVKWSTQKQLTALKQVLIAG
jgi:hypothetical protein